MQILFFLLSNPPTCPNSLTMGMFSFLGVSAKDPFKCDTVLPKEFTRFPASVLQWRPLGPKLDCFVNWAWLKQDIPNLFMPSVSAFVILSRLDGCNGAVRYKLWSRENWLVTQLKTLDGYTGCDISRSFDFSGESHRMGFLDLDGANVTIRLKITTTLQKKKKKKR